MERKKINIVVCNKILIVLSVILIIANVIIGDIEFVWLWGITLLINTVSLILQLKLK